MRIPQPMSAEDEKSSGRESVWKTGTYDFEIHDASDDVSQASGEEMIKLTLYVYNEDGDKRTVFDYLPSSPKAQWKVRGFCKATGLLSAYEGGDLDVNDIVDRTGKLKLGIKKAQGEYAENNMVTAYVPASETEPPKTRAAAPKLENRRAADLDDEIPF